MPKLHSCTRGVTMMEYSLIAALLAIAVITILATLGHSISSEFSRVNAAMSVAKPTTT